MRPLRVLTVLIAVAAVSTAVTPTIPASAASGRASASAGRSWHVAYETKAGPLFTSFTAITATGPKSAWAFEGSGSGQPSAYQLSGSTWKKRAFPGTSTEEVVSASSSSASNVWAFTDTGAALRFNGSSWSVVKTFSGEIISGLAISATDVWVFGGAGQPAEHYNGTSWKSSAAGLGLEGASALSPSSIWAYSRTGAAHWNGSTWTTTSLLKLIPKTPLGSPFVAGIYARSARNIYALGSEGGESVGGPLVLLHDSGAGWRRVAISKKVGAPLAIIPDGAGGLWIPVDIFILDSRMDHFAHGALTIASLPIRSTQLELTGAAIAPRSKVAFAVGYKRSSPTTTRSTAVILEYES